jgi:hypothetical protein
MQLIFQQFYYGKEIQMVIDPGTAMLIATAVATAAKGAGDYFGSQREKEAAKRRSKETKRETYGGLYENALERGAELEAHRLGSSAKLGRRRAQSLQDTSDIVRGALRI